MSKSTGRIGKMHVRAAVLAFIPICAASQAIGSDDPGLDYLACASKAAQQWFQKNPKATDADRPNVMSTIDEMCTEYAKKIVAEDSEEGFDDIRNYVNNHLLIGPPEYTATPP